MVEDRPKHYISSLLISLITLTILFYFIYHLFQGDRGILALRRIQKELKRAETQLIGLQQEQARLESQVQKLRPETLDLDLLEQQVRILLDLSDPDEVIIPIPKDMKNAQAACP